MTPKGKPSNSARENSEDAQEVLFIRSAPQSGAVIKLSASANFSILQFSFIL
jgi:hypothetical protein